MTGIIMVMRGKLLYATLLHIYVYVRIRYALNLCATSDELDACMGGATKLHARHAVHGNARKFPQFAAFAN